MRILYVCEDRGIAVAGQKGASVHVRAITAALTRAGHRVVLAAVATGGDAPDPLGVRVEMLPGDPTDRRAVLAALVGDADVVVERHSLDGGAARLAARRCGVPYVLELNAPLVDEAARFRGLLDVDRHHGIEDAAIAAADICVAVSRPLVTTLRGRVPSARVELLRNGVAPADPTISREVQRRALGLPDDAVVAVFTGSMKPWHGICELVDAFAIVAERHATAHLVVCGHGPLTDVVTRRVAALASAGRIHLLGAIPHSEVAAVLAACDVGVAPYLAVPDFWFCPLKVLEYLASGLPVVYSDLGDIAEIVGDAGDSVPADDVRGLAAVLGRLVTDGERRCALAVQARSRVATQTWDDVAATLTTLIGTVEAAGARAS